MTAQPPAPDRTESPYAPTIDQRALLPLGSQEPRTMQRRSSPRRWFWVLVALALLVAVVSARRYAAADVWRYSVATASSATLTERVVMGGTIRPVSTVTVGSEVSGTIAAVLVDPGSRVKAGDLLVRIDPDLITRELVQAQAKVAAARAGVERAEVAHERARRIRDRRSAAAETFSLQEREDGELDLATRKAELSLAQAELAQAEAERERASANVAKTRITAPLAGTVLTVSAEVGRTVAATLQAPDLVTIASDLAHVRVEVDLPEAELGRVRAGQTAVITVDAFPGRTWSGRVELIRPQPRALQNVVTYTALISITNVDEALLPGLSTTVGVEVSTTSVAVSVPTAALRVRPTGVVVPEIPRDRRLIWLAGPRGPQPRVVAIGQTADGQVAITDGLLAGEEVLTSAINTAANQGFALP